MKHKRHYTTGELAKIFGCAPRTVAKWADKGILPCHRIPLSLDRRFTRDDVMRFAAAHNIPLDFARERCIVVATGENALLFGLNDVCDTFQATDCFTLGVEMARRSPVAVVLDALWSESDMLEVIERIHSAYPSVLLAAIASEDNADAQVHYAAAGVRLVRRRPFHAAELGATILALITPHPNLGGNRRILA